MITLERYAISCRDSEHRQYERPFAPTGSPDRSHPHQRSAAPLTIEPHPAGILVREPVPATRSRTRFSPFANHRANRHRCRAAGVANQSRVDQVPRISRTVPAGPCPVDVHTAQHPVFRAARPLGGIALGTKILMVAGQPRSRTTAFQVCEGVFEMVSTVTSGIGEQKMYGVTRGSKTVSFYLVGLIGAQGQNRTVDGMGDGKVNLMYVKYL
jgi:hypothetical protein